MAKNKLKKYRVYTTFTGGWVYEVKAKSKKDAEENWRDLEWVKDGMDTGWCGDSNETIDKIEISK